MHAQQLPKFFWRSSQRIALAPAPVQAQNEANNEEQNEMGKFSDPFRTPLLLASHRPDLTLSAINFIPGQWPNANSGTPLEVDGKYVSTNICEAIAKGIRLSIPKPKTVEVSVQTEVSGDGMHCPKRLKSLQLDVENQIAVELMKNGMETDAVKHFLHASENGHLEAMNNLADCLFNGRGAKENKREAWRLWKEAAALGHSVAMYNLGVCYISGEGTDADENEGLKCMWKAANSGNPDASFYLILKQVQEQEENFDSIRTLVKNALNDPEYKAEICSWVRDKTIDGTWLRIIREESGIM